MKENLIARDSSYLALDRCYTVLREVLGVRARLASAPDGDMFVKAGVNHDCMTLLTCFDEDVTMYSSGD